MAGELAGHGQALAAKVHLFQQRELLNQETDLNANMSNLTSEMYCWYQCILFQAPR